MEMQAVLAYQGKKKSSFVIFPLYIFKLDDNSLPVTDSTQIRNFSDYKY